MADALPVLTPIGASRQARAPRAPAIAATALGLVVVASAVGGLFVRGGAVARPDPGSFFGPGTRPRLEILRDRLAAGLLSLRRPKGDFSTRDDDLFEDPTDRTEATALGTAGLAVAWRLGSRVAGLEEALRATKDGLGKRQARAGGFSSSGKPGRGRAVSALSSAILALSIAGDPADGPRLDRAAQTLADLCGLGPLPAGWVQGVAARAFSELAQGGRIAYLGTPPYQAIPSRDVGEVRDARDPRVSEAVAQAIRVALGGPRSRLPDEILARVRAEVPEWTGPQTDLYSWVLQAWLAARCAGGPAWFASVLGPLEKAVGPDGVIPGDFYGYPVSRTAGALLILWEGWELRPPGGP